MGEGEEGGEGTERTKGKGEGEGKGRDLGHPPMLYLASPWCDTIDSSLSPVTRTISSKGGEKGKGRGEGGSDRS